MAFGYEDKPVNKDALQTKEIVDIMLLGWRLQPTALGLLAKENEFNKTKCEAMGIEFEANKPTVKQCGMTWDYAVIRRARNGKIPQEWVFGSDEKDLEEPNYICYGQFDVDTPTQMLQKGFNYQCKVGGDKIWNGNVFLKNDFPKPNSDVFIDGKSEKFENIPDFLPNYQELLTNENNRKAKWDMILKAFNGLSEEQVIRELNENTSRRFLMCKILNQKPVYIIPKKGVIFRCSLFINQKGYTTLVPFKTEKVGDSYITHYYTNYDTSEPTEDEISYADALLALKKENKKKREEQKKEKATKSNAEAAFTEPKSAYDELIDYDPYDIEEAPF